MTKMPRDPELHKLRHHRQAGAHGGARRPGLSEREAIEEQDEHRLAQAQVEGRRPQIPRGNLVPMWCPRCNEVTIDEDESGVCPFCEDDTLQGFEE